LKATHIWHVGQLRLKKLRRVQGHTRCGRVHRVEAALFEQVASQSGRVPFFEVITPGEVDSGPQWVSVTTNWREVGGKGLVRT
jgi:hypothetical protein